MFKNLGDKIKEIGNALQDASRLNVIDHVPSTQYLSNEDELSEYDKH